MHDAVYYYLIRSGMAHTKYTHTHTVAQHIIGSIALYLYNNWVEKLLLVSQLISGAPMATADTEALWEAIKEIKQNDNV